MHRAVHGVEAHTLQAHAACGVAQAATVPAPCRPLAVQVQCCMLSLRGASPGRAARRRHRTPSEQPPHGRTRAAGLPLGPAPEEAAVRHGGRLGAAAQDTGLPAAAAAEGGRKRCERGVVFARNRRDHAEASAGPVLRQITAATRPLRYDAATRRPCCARHMSVGGSGAVSGACACARQWWVGGLGGRRVDATQGRAGVGPGRHTHVAVCRGCSHHG